MQMIDVLKRLAELDAANPAVDTGAKVVAPQQNISVNENLDECGMMGGMSEPHTPASINMTASSGEELSAMLKDIMTLAGQAGHADHDMAEPADGIAVPSMEPDSEPGMDAATSMRSMIDKLNGPDDGVGQDDDGEEDDEEAKEWSNSAADPRNAPKFDSNKMANQDPAGNPGAGDRMDGDRPKAFATFEDQLMAEYKQFVAEDGIGGQPQLVPGKFYVVAQEYGKVIALSSGFDNDNEAEAEKAEHGDDTVVAQWTGKDWNFDYMMKQGVAEGQDILKLAGLR